MGGGGGGGRGGCKTELCWLNKWKFAKCFNSFVQDCSISLMLLWSGGHLNGCYTYFKVHFENILRLRPKTCYKRDKRKLALYPLADVAESLF